VYEIGEFGKFTVSNNTTPNYLEKAVKIDKGYYGSQKKLLSKAGKC